MLEERTWGRGFVLNMGRGFLLGRDLEMGVGFVLEGFEEGKKGLCRDGGVALC